MAIIASLRCSWPKDVRSLSNSASILIAAGISIAIIAVVNGLGTQLNTVFGSVSSQLN